MSGSVAVARPPLTAHRGRGSVAGASLRRVMWRSVLAVSGGLTVRGSWPAGPCVIVANHSSHADSAALVAALPASHRPVVLAAADYWGSSRLRAWACRRLIGGMPIARGGGGAAGLAAARAALAQGRTVVVFPEGTRTRTGQLGAFHSGAFRLAAASGAPIVPVGIRGTRRLLGARQPPRHAAVSVEIGRATSASTTPAAARASVHELARGDVPAPDSEVRRRVAAFASSSLAVVVVGTWAVAEAVAWPIVTELGLAILAVAAPRRAFRLGVVGALASMLGGLLLYGLVVAGVRPPQPLVTDQMRATVAQQTSVEGPAAVRNQALNGIPFKVYVAEAARRSEPVGPFLAHAAAARGLRIVAVSLMFAGAAALLRRLRHLYPAYVVLLVVGFGLGLAQVVLSWN
ncbi:MAG: lysophospholipid acyltransferase family protein [Candidatus Nanopelagicales bacterium]